MFEFDILKSEDFSIINNGKKVLVTVSDDESLTTWLKKDSIKPVGNFLPVFSSSFNTKKKIKPFGDSLGYCYFTANRVEYNQQYVSLLTTPFSISRGFYITRDNFNKSMVGYSSRVLVNSNVWNANDEYKKPLIDSQKFEQFTYDSIILNLFSNGSGQVSLRNFEHMGQIYNIKNEFFWMSVDRMKTLADKTGYDELYNDARTSPDRHVHKLLFGPEKIYEKLSPNAKAVLDKATELVELSMEMRQMMTNDENHLNSWDAGYAQLKLLWKEYLPQELKEFRQLYKNMEDQMRPLVYELGFLMK